VNGGRCLVAPLALLAAAACAAPSPGASRPSAAGVPAAQRFHPDMSQPFLFKTSCEGASVPVRQMIAWVGRPAAGRAAAVVRVLRIGPPRWNTVTGARPATSEAAAMIERGVDGPDHGPRIYTPLELGVVRIIAGLSPPRQITAFARAGRIAGDEVSGCTFSLATDGRLRIREERSLVEIGASYLVIFGNEMLTERSSGPLGAPVIDDLFEIRSGMVVGPNGVPEPLPH